MYADLEILIMLVNASYFIVLVLLDTTVVILSAESCGKRPDVCQHENGTSLLPCPLSSPEVILTDIIGNFFLKKVNVV